jgi:hypothetical protein
MSLQQAFIAAVAAQGRRATWGLLQFIEAWQTFVVEVAAGYSGDLYEYENELSVRDDLEFALSNPDLQKYPEWADLQAAITTIDSRFRSLLEQGPGVHLDAKWWRARLPARAGAEFAEDAKRLFGVEVISE